MFLALFLFCAFTQNIHSWVGLFIYRGKFDEASCKHLIVSCPIGCVLHSEYRMTADHGILVPEVTVI